MMVLPNPIQYKNKFRQGKRMVFLLSAEGLFRFREKIEKQDLRSGKVSLIKKNGVIEWRASHEQ
jgi:hypothetical protein